MSDENDRRSFSDFFRTKEIVQDYRLRLERSLYKSIVDAIRMGHLTLGKGIQRAMRKGPVYLALGKMVQLKSKIPPFRSQPCHLLTG